MCWVIDIALDDVVNGLSLLKNLRGSLTSFGDKNYVKIQYSSMEVNETIESVTIHIPFY